MDNKQLIHMACEGLVIGGVVLYFSKQMKTMNKEIEDLKSIIAKNQAANEKRFEVIFNFLDNVNGGFMPPQHQPLPPQQPRPQPQREGKKTPQPSKVKTVKFEEEELEPKPLPSKKKPQMQKEQQKVVKVVKDDIEKLKEMQEECDPETEVCNNDVTDIQEEMSMLTNGEDIEESVEDSLDE
jgi:hypothetical protein